MILFYFVLLNILECIKIAETYVAWAFLVHNLLLPSDLTWMGPWLPPGTGYDKEGTPTSLCPFWVMAGGPEGVRKGLTGLRRTATALARCRGLRWGLAQVSPEVL